MNILIVRNDKIGDFITALPSCYIIKQHLTDCRLTVLVSPINESLALACNFIDEVIVDNGQTVNQLASELKAKHFDVSLTLFSNTRVALAQWKAGINKRFAPATKIAQIFYNKRITQRRSEVKMAEFEYNIQLIQAAIPDINTQFPQPLLNFSQKSLETSINSFRTQVDTTKNIIAFHPGFGGSSDANWSVAEYIELAETLSHRDDIEIVFTFGPGDEAFLETYQKLATNLNTKVFISKESVVEFAKIMSTFALFVSTSTGTFHIASAVGTKTMTFFADSLFASPKRWRGIGDISLQYNFMLPTDPTQRQKCFEQVKQTLQEIA